MGKTDMRAGYVRKGSSEQKYKDLLRISLQKTNECKAKKEKKNCFSSLFLGLKKEREYYREMSAQSEVAELSDDLVTNLVI